MVIAPLPADETRRLQVLRDYYMLDTQSQQAFDAITAAASVLCGTPIATISLVDEHRQWFKSRQGLDSTETSRDVAFCAHVVHSGEPLEVTDAALDVRFHDNPLVVADPPIRFYAGAPLKTPEGHTLGTLCVLDRQPRALSEIQRQTLAQLGAAVMALMEAHKNQAHETLLGRIADASHDQIFLIDARDGHLVHINAGACAALGGQRAELLQHPGRELLQQVCGQSFEALLEGLRAGGAEGLEVSGWLQRSDGSRYPVEGRVQSCQHGNNQLCALYLRDVTRRREIERALRDSESRVRSITDNLPALIAEVDADRRYRFCNAAYAHVFGGSPREMSGKHLAEIGPSVYAAIEQRVSAVLAGQAQTFEGEMQIGDRCYQYESRFIPARDREGGVRGFFALTYDIGDRKKLEQVLRQQATHDALTGLPNRSQLQSHFLAAVARAAREQKFCAVLFLDLDRFKQINDHYGHATGDQVLQHVANRMRSALRASDLPARLAGDEFVIVAEGLESVAEAATVADKVLAAVCTPLTLASGELTIGSSMGVALWPEHGQTLEDLLHVADAAMYGIKQSGRAAWRMAATTAPA